MPKRQPERVNKEVETKNKQCGSGNERKETGKKATKNATRKMVTRKMYQGRNNVEETATKRKQERVSKEEDVRATEE